MDHDHEEKFLESLREAPRPGHARALRERLRQVEALDAPQSLAWWRPALAGAFAIAALVMAFSLPSVRAQAQAMLDLFRVRTFAVVQLDAAQVERLQKQKLDPEALLGGKVERVREGGKPQLFTDMGAATAAAGFAPRVPRTLPEGFVADTIAVMGASESRVTVDTKNLRELMQTMAVNDLTVPAGLDGQIVTMRTQPAIMQRFRNQGQDLAFLQSESPELGLPAGVDLSRLGEIGLRLLGLERGEAHRMAQHVDWHSTMLVPLQANATAFHEVTVHGQRGLLMESKESKESKDSKADAPAGADTHERRFRGGRTLLWTEQGRVYALMGRVNTVELMQCAESVR